MISRSPRTSPHLCLWRSPIAPQTVFAFITCTLALLCNAWELHAQSTDNNFEHLTVEQGLSFNEVTAIMQDSRGFMWFGTANGLNKYDGYNFTTYKTDLLDSASISGPWTNILYEDTHGDLWITTGGLNRLDRGTGKISRYLSDRHLTSICEDPSAHASQDGMWFTTFGQGIYRYDRRSNRFAEYRHSSNDSNCIGSDSTFCSSVDITGTLWIGTAHGVNSLDRSRQQFAHYPHGPKGNVYTIYEDPDEPSRLLWIGTQDGLYLYDKSSDSFSRYQNDFGNPKRAEDNDVRTVYRDRKGRLWVGMMGGLARFNRSARRFTSYEGGLSTNTWGYVNKAWTICEDKTGTMWMVSHWGPLRKYDEVTNKWTPVRILSDHEITFHALCEDRSGTMWFGTVADGVLKLDRARKPFSFYTKIPGDSSSLSVATVTGICEDASGAVWVGTMGGLSKLNASTGKFTHYRHDDRNPNSLSHDMIWPVLEDRKGMLWIGTYGGGLDEFDRSRQRFVHHRYRQGDSLSLPNDAVGALCESRDGTLWIGTDHANITEYSPASNIYRRHLPGYAKTGGVAAQVIAAGDSLFRSTDDGANWTNIYRNYGIKAIAINDSDYIFIGYGNESGGELDRSTDNGASWISAMGVSNTYAFAISASGTIFAGGWNGSACVFRSTDNGSSWTNTGFFTFYYPVHALAISPAGHIFVGTSSDGVVHSTDNGAHWIQSNAGIMRTSFVTCLATNASGAIFAGTFDKGIFRSTDDGANWTSVNTGLSNNIVLALAISDSGTIFAVTEGDGLFRSVQSTTSVRELSADAPMSFSLDQNYPNPFNPSTTIQFSIPRAAHVVLKVFNTLGEEVTTLISEELGAGAYTTQNGMPQVIQAVCISIGL